MKSGHWAKALGVACALTLGATWAAHAQDAASDFAQQADAGAYLAARAAMKAGDFTQASAYLTAAIGSDSANPMLLESALAADIGRGTFADALPIAENMTEMGLSSQLASMVQTQAYAGAKDWTGLLALLDSGPAISPLADRMLRGWSLAGEGDMQAAIGVFAQMAEERGLRAFGLYHKALVLAFVGDFESADAILSTPPEQGLRPSRRMVVAHAQILSQLDRNAEAVALIDRTFPLAADPDIADLRARLVAGEALPWTMVRSPAAGLAEAFYSLAGAILDETDDVTVLFQARMAQALDPDHVDAQFLVAQLLERLNQYDLAAQTYAAVPQTHPSYPLAVLGRAFIIGKTEGSDAAIALLTELAQAYPDLLAVKMRIADVYLGDDRFDDAVAAYDAVLADLPDGDAARWRVHYSRAIAHYARNDWPAAEADFIAALALSPNQPGLLNYYGYSLVERGEKLDEALAMIEQAVSLDPDNGAIVDSLGWALYRQGRVTEALPHLERAAALEPTDAVVNDHLGDVYWQVGRKREAQFQWARALSFATEGTDADAIRRKLVDGLGPDGAAPPAQERQETGG